MLKKQLVFYFLDLLFTCIFTCIFYTVFGVFQRHCILIIGYVSPLINRIPPVLTAVIILILTFE